MDAVLLREEEYNTLYLLKSLRMKAAYKYKWIEHLSQSRLYAYAFM